MLLLSRRVVPTGAPAASETDEMDVSQPEQVILDPNAMAKASGSTYYELGNWMVRLLPPSCAAGVGCGVRDRGRVRGKGQHRAQVADGVAIALEQAIIGLGVVHANASV